jgi:hypothetical protein
MALEGGQQCQECTLIKNPEALSSDSLNAGTHIDEYYFFLGGGGEDAQNILSKKFKRCIHLFSKRQKVTMCVISEKIAERFEAGSQTLLTVPISQKCVIVTVTQLQHSLAIHRIHLSYVAQNNLTCGPLLDLTEGRMYVQAYNIFFFSASLLECFSVHIVLSTSSCSSQKNPVKLAVYLQCRRHRGEKMILILERVDVDCCQLSSVSCCLLVVGVDVGCRLLVSVLYSFRFKLKRLIDE